MFVHLHVHSQYSILDALASVSGIAQQAKHFQMPAVALTDHGNLFGAIEFYKECISLGVKPIIGCEVYVAPESRLDKKKTAGQKTAFHLTLLAKNSEGYHNLCKLSSIAYLEGFYYHPRIDAEVLKKYSSGLICLSGCMSSRVAHEILHGTEEKVREILQWHLDVFGGDYYLELQRSRSSEEQLTADGIFQETWLEQQYRDFVEKQDKVNRALVTYAAQLGIPLVATNDSHYIQREDWRAHEILLNIQSGEPCEVWERDSLGNPKFCRPNPKRRTYASHEVYFKSPEQMAALFQDLPEAVSNTHIIAEKCALELDFKTKHYPSYTPPSLEGKKFTMKEQRKGVEEFLWKLCREGIPVRYTKDRLEKVKENYPGKDPVEVITERLNYEMATIVPKGMCDYLLIVWDFINWAKKQGIPVGPGRGSGAGSIVLYLIGVTDIEPLRFHLFFERFINPERISYPDIDVDICMDRRAEVIEYTLKKYGKDNVAQIITFGTMKAKMSIKDVGRVLSVPLTKVNAIAKLVPDDLNITLEKALEKDPELRSLYESDKEAHRIIDIARKLEGSIRNTGIHAAGMIICGDPLVEHIPLCLAKDSSAIGITMPVTQYSMGPVEKVGMLKIDFLGLKALTCIVICVNAVKDNGGASIDWVNLPLDDQATFKLLNQGKTLGVFQLESAGMQGLARELHLDKFEEIFAVGALYRPGPMDMIPSFINRKHGREPIEYDHPWLKEILDETNGIMVYQEQVMMIAQKLAKYSLGEGDVLRKAMGKKDQDQMAKEREKFRKGAIKNGIDAETATKIFDKMEKFAAYGFNKSHAAAYGYLSYVTAYLKANHTREWLAALMTCDRDDTAKVGKFICEAQVMGISMLPPDINEAGDAFIATAQGIRFAMSGIKGVGTGVVEAIIEERNRKGPFRSLYDFIMRIDTSKVGKKNIELMVDAGCFDFTGWDRDSLRESTEPMFESTVKEKKEKALGILSLFDRLGISDEKRFAEPPPPLKKTSKIDRWFKEKELLGFFLTGHPLQAYGEVMKRLSCMPLRLIQELPHDSIIRTAFIVEAAESRFSQKTQKKFAIVTISDGMERFELPIWAELYEEKNHLLIENKLLYAVLQIDRREEDLRLQCRWIDDLMQASEQMVAECDRAYDRAKQQLGRVQFRKQEKKEAKVMKPVQSKVFPFIIDIDQCRLSHFLKIKEIFGEHRGEIPVELQFHAKGVHVASIHIDQTWGINGSAALEKELAQLFHEVK